MKDAFLQEPSTREGFLKFSGCWGYIQLNQGRQRQFREAAPTESNALPDGSVRVKPRQYKGKF